MTREFLPDELLPVYRTRDQAATLTAMRDLLADLESGAITEALFRVEHHDGTRFTYHLSYATPAQRNATLLLMLTLRAELRGIA